MGDRAGGGWREESRQIKEEVAMMTAAAAAAAAVAAVAAAATAVAAGATCLVLGLAYGRGRDESRWGTMMTSNKSIPRTT
jgi:hypothetical protein